MQQIEGGRSGDNDADTRDVVDDEFDPSADFGNSLSLVDKQQAVFRDCRTKKMEITLRELVRKGYIVTGLGNHATGKRRRRGEVMVNQRGFTNLPRTVENKHLIGAQQLCDLDASDYHEFRALHSLN